MTYCSANPFPKTVTVDPAKAIVGASRSMAGRGKKVNSLLNKGDCDGKFPAPEEHCAYVWKELLEDTNGEMKMQEFREQFVDGEL